jgi:hypothetical protein
MDSGRATKPETIQRTDDMRGACRVRQEALLLGNLVEYLNLKNIMIASIAIRSQELQGYLRFFSVSTAQGR